MNTENNRRWQENAAAMEKALLELLENRKFSKITVRDICGGAGVNRSTFYRHYLDMSDLMEKTAWHVMQNFLDRVEEIDDLKGQTGVEAYFRRDILTEVLRHVKKYRSFYLAYYEQNPDLTGIKGYGAIWEKCFVPMFTGIRVTETRHMRYYFGFFQAGLMTTIRTWLQDGCPEEADELAGIIFNMMQAERFEGNTSENR